MIVGVGIDLIRNSHVNKALVTHKTVFLKKILTEEELKRINLNKISIQHLAGIFAVKEAVIKSLTSFLGFPLQFQEIAIKKNSFDVPIAVIISNRAENALSSIKLSISISHEGNYAIGLSIAEIV